MIKLVLLRHGESIWNKENRFTGWTDVDLSEKGVSRGAAGGQAAAEEGYTFDVAYTSVLKRAIRTLWIALDEHGPDVDPGAPDLAAERAPLRRAAGAEQGRDGREVRRGAGARSGAAATTSRRPPSTLDDPRYPGNDPRYADLAADELPLTECLKDTVARFLPYWHETIAPACKAGKRVLIAAHGNSLRALVKYLDNIPDEEIVELNIPTGIPLVYELDDDLKPIRHYYLGDPEAVARAAAAVAAQAQRR